MSVRTTASPISRMGCLGGGWLAASLAERERDDAHQHRAARTRHPEANRPRPRGVKIAAAAMLLQEGVAVAQESHPASLAHSRDRVSRERLVVHVVDERHERSPPTPRVLHGSAERLRSEGAEDVCSIGRAVRGHQQTET